MRWRRVTIPGMEFVATVMYAVASRHPCVLAIAPTLAKEACDDDEGYYEDTSEDNEPGDR
jgi:hypothetical protein